MLPKASTVCNWAEKPSRGFSFGKEENGQNVYLKFQILEGLLSV